MNKFEFPKNKKIALISVFNKDGLVEFAKDLIEMDWFILSSGGTAKKLEEAGIPVTDVSALTGGEAILGHRVVTLSREIGAALLADTKNEKDLSEMQKLNLPIIDLVCCDFYPLEKAIDEHGDDLNKIIAMTDIGGPTLVREAAKGNRIVICDYADRDFVINELKTNGDINEEQRQKLRAKAEYEVAKYVSASAFYHGNGEYKGFLGKKIKVCKYGENPYLIPAALYSNKPSDPLSLDKFKLVEGTDPSFINWTDVDRLLQTITHIAGGFDINFNKFPSIALGAKHGNTCGAAIGESPKDVIEKMVMGDHLAIFGGLVMVNFDLTAELVDILLTTNMPAGQRLILDGVVAPTITPEAVELLKRKKDKCRILANPALASLNKDSLDQADKIRPVRGGFLAQPAFTFILDLNHHELIKTSNDISEEQKADLILAWAIGSTSNSNTTTLVKDGQLLGNGVGQQSRVASCQLAILRAKAGSHDLTSAVAYTDSFFPFTDAPDELIKAGIEIIFSSSGSIKDPEVQSFCKNKNVTLFQLPDKICRGFFGH